MQPYEVGVETPTTDLVAARFWKCGNSKPRHHRPKHHHRTAQRFGLAPVFFSPNIVKIYIICLEFALRRCVIFHFNTHFRKHRY